MNAAVLLVDKPAGPTSFGCVARVRGALGGRKVKVGHAGTLDPFATGLLALLVGRATRLAPYLVGPRQALPHHRAARRALRHGRSRGHARAGEGPLPDADALARACAELDGRHLAGAAGDVGDQDRRQARLRARACRRGGRDARARGARPRVRRRLLRRRDGPRRARHPLLQGHLRARAGARSRRGARLRRLLRGAAAAGDRAPRDRARRHRSTRSPRDRSTGALAPVAAARRSRTCPRASSTPTERDALLHGRAIDGHGEDAPAALRLRGAARVRRRAARRRAPLARGGGRE